MRRMIAGAVIAMTAAACGGGGTADATKTIGAPSDGIPSGTVASVDVRNLKFRPESITVEAGTAVTWTNADDISHTVTAGDPGKPSGAFESSLDGPGASFTHVFSAAGTFPYFCSIHTAMTGTIVVT